MGDSGLEILHGGVGGDVEQGARTSKHIVVFAFTPLVSLTLSPFILCKASSHSYCHIIHCLCCLALFHIAIYCICLVVCVCITYTHPTRASHSASTHFKGNQEELVQSPSRGIRLHLLDCI